MGTRNLTCVVYDKKYRVAQYGQWDGYPSGAGLDILIFLRKQEEDDYKKFIKKVSTCKLVDSEKADDWLIDRDIGCEILRHVVKERAGRKLPDCLHFAGDSLFCEWAYVVDLDKMQLEVYEGFNETPLKRGDRFYKLQGQGYKSFDHTYYPVKLVATFPLDKLPTNRVFLKSVKKGMRNEQ